MSGVHVFVDVDGVLNAVGVSTPKWGWNDGGSAVTVNGFRILYAPPLIERLNALAEMPGVTMHWLTTWEHDAPTKLAPELSLNASEWTVVGTEEHYSKELAGSWWKLAALRDLITETKPAAVVWIDDDIDFDPEAREWLETVPHVLPVCPRTHVGVTAHEMNAIEVYVKAELARAVA